MTTPINYPRLPQAESTHAGRVVMGGVVSQLALSLKQLQGVKYRSMASYHVGRSTYVEEIDVYNLAQVFQGGYQTIEKAAASEDHNLFIATMPSSEWLAIEITYACAGDTASTPSITLELYDDSTIFKDNKIDTGVIFQSPIDISTSVNIRGMEVRRASTGAEPVIIPSGGFAEVTGPRPLYIPEANRGQVLMLCIQADGAFIYNVNVFDIYQEAT